MAMNLQKKDFVENGVSENMLKDGTKQKSLIERVDQLTMTVENTCHKLDRFIDLYESEKLAAILKEERGQRKKMEVVASEDPEKEKLQQKMFAMKSEMEQQAALYVQLKKMWKQDQEQLQKELRYYKSLCQKSPTENSPTSKTQAKPKETDKQELKQSVYEPLDVWQYELVDTEKFEKQREQDMQEWKYPLNTVMNVGRTSHYSQTEQGEPSLASTSKGSDSKKESETVITQTGIPIKNQWQKHLRKLFLSLLENHECKNSDCSVVGFKKSLKHAIECTDGRECGRYICECLHHKIEHFKVCKDRNGCTFGKYDGHVTAKRIHDMLNLLEMGCPLNTTNLRFDCFLARKRGIMTIEYTVVNYGFFTDNDRATDLKIPRNDFQLSSSSLDEDTSFSPISQEWELVESQRSFGD